MFSICRVQSVAFVLLGFTRTLQEGESSCNFNPSWTVENQDSTVNIVTGYGLDG
jgi:hypothetical protein